MADASPLGARLHVLEQGVGRPTLFLHTALAHSGQWRGILRHLTDRHCLAPDLPGHGRSAPLADRPDVHDQCTDAVAALMSQRPSDGLEIVAASFGATVALRLAIEARLPISRMVLIEPVFFAAADALALAGYVQASAAQTQAMQQGDMTEAARLFFADWGDGTRFDDLPAPQQAYVVERMSFVQRTSPALVEDAANMLRPGGLEGVTCPVVLMEGTASPPIIPSVTSALAARLPNARRVVVPGAGHMLHQTHPKSVLTELAMP